MEIDTRNVQARRQYQETWGAPPHDLSLMTSRLGIPLVPIPPMKISTRHWTQGLARHFWRR